MSHLGYCMLGICALTAEGATGSAYQMLNHGVSTGALFLLFGFLYERRHTRLMQRLRRHRQGDAGVHRALPDHHLLVASRCRAPTASSASSWCCSGTFKSEPAAVASACSPPPGVILGAAYMLWMVQRVFFGPLTHRENQRPHGPEPPRARHRAALRGAGAGDGPDAAAASSTGIDALHRAVHAPAPQRGPRRAARATSRGRAGDGAASLPPRLPRRVPRTPLPAAVRSPPGASEASMLHDHCPTSPPPTSCRCCPRDHPGARGDACCCSPRCSSPRPSRALPGACWPPSTRGARRRGGAAATLFERRARGVPRLRGAGPVLELPHAHRLRGRWRSSALLAPGFLQQPQRRARRVLRADALRRRAGMSLLGAVHRAHHHLHQHRGDLVATYALTAYLRRGPRPREAGFKYFILGAFSLGAAALRRVAALRRHRDHAARRDGRPLAPRCVASAAGRWSTRASRWSAPGFAFKVAAVPFHMWTPDVYEGAPTPVTALMSAGGEGGRLRGAGARVPRRWAAASTRKLPLLASSRMLALPHHGASATCSRSRSAT